MKGMRSITPFGVRMPDDLKESLTIRAAQNGRSLNSEIVMILQEAVDAVSQKPKNNAEHQAAIQAEEFKKSVYDTLVKLYEKDEK
ncbi:Arc family DNA-binding protein [Providencia sp. PROV128]|uniref:Arc family DNA-binding protein n=1 Tax=Providencia sp. PROV128 TaxID=2949838 RepID=UPI00234BD41A|nr:Arc family DNA-binding protein [Providencia sp. PROV128]